MPAIIKKRGDRIVGGVTFGALNELKAFCELIKLGGYWDKYKISAKHSLEGDITVIAERGGFSRQHRLPIPMVEQRDWLRIIELLNAQDGVAILNREPMDAERIMGVIRDGALH